ncbi:MAG: type II secretion system F family protein [Alphaproteobacteria bacterium]|nr:type II secretion system F family protein [Alphaproteobacteria bacterium]
MTLFRYRALNNEGHYQTGDWFGMSSKELYSHLQKQNLQLISAKAVRKKPWHSFPIFYINSQELIDFCVHMEQLDKVKMSLTESILLFASTVKNRSFKAILFDIHQSITKGFLLSEACSIHPKIFDSIFVQCLNVAEKTGTLNQAFNHLQKHLSWKKEQQTKLKQSLRYPLILASILLLLMAFMIVFVTPHLEDYLEILGVKEKPLALKALIFLGSMVREQGTIMFLMLFALSSSYYIFRKISLSFQKVTQRLLFLIPGWGSIKKDLLIGNFFQTFSILLNQKLDLLLSLEKAIDTIPNQFLKEKLSSAPSSIRQGFFLSDALRETTIFSPFALRLIQLGEESGSLGYLLDQTAKIQLRNTLKRLHSLLAWTEPVLITIIGIVMMWIVAATVVPLYDNLALFDL